MQEAAAYDPAGNFLGAANASLVGASGRHFFHNSENRLLTAVLPGVVYDYVYDPSGRRVLKAQRGGGAALAFVHAGDMEIADIDPASGAVRQRYVPGAGVDRRAVTITVAWLFDCRGVVRKTGNHFSGTPLWWA